jgi:hypothetical protein
VFWGLLLAFDLRAQAISRRVLAIILVSRPVLATSQQALTAALLLDFCWSAWQQDTTGLGVILLTALTEEQWVEEDDFARKLNLPAKMVRKALRYLEQVR